MKARSLLATLAVVSAMLACNMASVPAPTPLPPPASATPMVSETPSITPLPTDTPPPTATATPTIPIAWPKDLPVNCRIGPGLDWLAVSGLLVGQTAPIQGRNSNSSWWYVVTQQEPGAPCWVAASATLTAGNVAALPVIGRPQARVTAVDLSLQPRNQSLPGCFGPPQLIEFDGTITTNGPTDVEWYFDTDEGGSMPSHTLHFDKYGTKSVDGSYLPTTWPGQFWVRLIVSDPNNRQAEKRYRIDC